MGKNGISAAQSFAPSLAASSSRSPSPSACPESTSTPPPRCFAAVAKRRASRIAKSTRRLWKRVLAANPLRRRGRSPRSRSHVSPPQCSARPPWRPRTTTRHRRRPHAVTDSNRGSAQVKNPLRKAAHRSSGLAGPSLSSTHHVNRLPLLVAAKRLGTELAPHAACLHAAEW